MIAKTQVTGERTTAQAPVGRSVSVRLHRALAMILVGVIGSAVLVWYYLDLAGSARAEGETTTTSKHSAFASEMKLPGLGGDPRGRTQKVVQNSADGEPGMQSDAPAAQGRAAPHAYQPPPERPSASNTALSGAAAPSSSPVLARGNALSISERLSGLADGAPAEADAPRNTAIEVGDSPVVRRTAPVAGQSHSNPIEAELMPDRRWLLPKGTFIDCTLETAIDTTLGGLATCVVATDVFGNDGRVVLLDRGTRLLGDVRSEVQAGQARVGVVWTEARAPSGVIAALGSPGTDSLGRAGIPGTVDRHTSERFGAAVLLSLIDGAINAVVAHQQSGGGSVVYNAQGSRDVATEALRNNMNVAPTIRVPPGTRMLVSVVRDVDFRSVYVLGKRGG